MRALVTLKKGEGRTLKSGGLWVYDNEIASILGHFENGDLVEVADFDGYGMGVGFIIVWNIEEKLWIWKAAVLYLERQTYLWNY